MKISTNVWHNINILPQEKKQVGFLCDTDHYSSKIMKLHQRAVAHATAALVLVGERHA